MTLGGIGLTSSTARSRLVDKLRSEKLAGEEVLAILDSIPRHVFVDEAVAHRAYDNTVLPIGHRQTISQPAVIAMMSDSVASVSKRDKILEIGTGCGYQTAVIARLFKEVYTVERIQSLSSRAQQTLNDLNFHNVHCKFDDGHAGWLENAPFDAIIVTAAAEGLPEALLDQLRVGGRLVIPVVEFGVDAQELIQMDRLEEGFLRKWIGSVRFVPMLKGTVS